MTRRSLPFRARFPLIFFSSVAAHLLLVATQHTTIFLLKLLFFAKKSERSLLSPIQLYDVDKNNNLILNTLFSFKNAINERGNRIADILSELVSAATDETKDQQNAKYNLSMEALNIVTPMLMLGGASLCVTCSSHFVSYRLTM